MVDNRASPWPDVCKSFANDSYLYCTMQSDVKSMKFPWIIGCVGHRGSVVACATYKREIVTSIPSYAELFPDDIVLLGKALCPQMHSLDPGVSGYLVGQCLGLCVGIILCTRNGSRAVCSLGS